MFKSNLKLVTSNKEKNLQDKKIKIRKGLILKLRAVSFIINSPVSFL